MTDYDHRLQTLDYRLWTKTIDCRLQALVYGLQTIDSRLQTIDHRLQISYRLQSTETMTIHYIDYSIDYEHGLQTIDYDHRENQKNVKKPKGIPRSIAKPSRKSKKTKKNQGSEQIGRRLAQAKAGSGLLFVQIFGFFVFFLIFSMVFTTFLEGVLVFFDFSDFVIVFTR